MSDHESMRMMLIGLTVAGFLSFAVIWAAVVLYDRRQERKATERLRERSEEWGL